MTKKEAPKTDIKRVADETLDLLLRHMQSNTTEEDARMEAEEDARVAQALKELAAEGKLPPKR